MISTYKFNLVDVNIFVLGSLILCLLLGIRTLLTCSLHTFVANDAQLCPENASLLRVDQADVLILDMALDNILDICLVKCLLDEGWVLAWKIVSDELS